MNEQTDYTPDKRVFSFGGGRQSVSVLVMQALGMLDKPFDAFLFANVGEQAERQGTLDYFRSVALPFAKQHGVELIEVARTNKDGQRVDLYDHVMRDRKGAQIPVYLNGKQPASRICTSDWKIRQIDKWLKSQSVYRAEVGLGISTDEIERMKSTDWYDSEPGEKGRALGFWKRNVYPLIDARMAFQDCVRVILRAGLPLPPKSSCWFCPFTSRSEWILMRNDDPELFDKAVELEKHVNRCIAHTGSVAFLHRDKKPLEQAVSQQKNMFDDNLDDECGGFCHT